MFCTVVLVLAASCVPVVHPGVIDSGLTEVLARPPDGKLLYTIQSFKLHVGDCCHCFGISCICLWFTLESLTAG
jgi:hypothetical protein